MLFVNSREFVDAFIDFPKPLAAAVNGPAVGIAVTTLGLCDLVYCTDKVNMKLALVHLPQSAAGYIPHTIHGAWSKSRGLLILYIS